MSGPSAPAGAGGGGPVLVGLDLGGSGVRCLVWDVEGGGRTVASRPWRGAQRRVENGMGHEIDLDRLWPEIVAATREAVGRAGVAPERVRGVAATAMRFAHVLLDAGGEVLQAVSNRDGRGGPTAARLHERGAVWHARTGHWPAAILQGGRLCWLAERDPSVFERVAHSLGLADWVAWRLSGEVATDPATAGSTGLLDVAAAAWADDLAAELGLPTRILPPLRAPGTALGPLGAGAAEALGLPAGIAVAVGTADSQAGLLAGDVGGVGDAGIVGGSTAPALHVLDALRTDAEGRLWSASHALAERFVLESNAGAIGDGIEWLGRVLSPGARAPAAWLLAEAASSEPGASGQLSTLGGEIMDARSMMVPIADLTLCPMAAPDGAEARRHLARAVVEGAACALRANLEQVRAVVGEERSVTLVGGLGRSAFFARVLADVLGRPVRVGPGAEASALGAAVCAGVAAGVFADLAEGAAASAGRGGPGAPVEREPEPSLRAFHDDLYARWRAHREGRVAANGPALQGAVPVAMAGGGAGAAAAPSVRPRMLVTADLDETALARLRGLGEVEAASYREKMRLLSGDALVAALEGFEVFVTEIDVVDADALLRLPELRVVATCRGDAVNVDVPAASALGIPVLHAPGRNAEAVADLAVAFLLALARRLPEATEFLRDPSIEAGDMARMGRAFKTLRAHELGSRTVGLVGFGAVGRAVARRLAPFGARVLVADPFLDPLAAARADVEAVELGELLERSDLVSLHAAVTDATRGLLGGDELARMRPGAGLVNTARAALVDEEALAAALREGHLAGAALDVFSVEPPGADHPLLALPGVIATPHIGGNTHEVSGHQGRIIGEDLARLLAGQPPRHALDPAVAAGLDWSAPRPAPDAATAERLRARPKPAVTDLQRKRPARKAVRASPKLAPGASPKLAPGASPKLAPGESTGPGPDAGSGDVAGPDRLEIAGRLRRILAGFTEAFGRDERVRVAAAGRDVTLHFQLTDLPVEFHLRLRGAPSGDLGPPDAPAEVELRMRADVLDGMFTGRVNAMREAMDGGLSFSGDAGKAMTLQELEGDLSRLYGEAREAAGDPGDLAGLPRPEGAPAPSGREGREGRAGGAREGDPRAELCRIVADLYEQELVTATGGNVSAHVPGSDEVWITPSQLFKGDLSPEVLVRVDLDGRPLDPAAHSPSSERMMHCAVYRAKPEARAVVHAHAPHATILANADLPFLAISTEAAFFGDIPRVPFVMPGTDELARAVAEAMGDGWAVLMKNHGLLVAGRSLRRAADMAEIIDRSARVMLGCWSVGREPPVLPDDVVEGLRRMGDLVA